MDDLTPLDVIRKRPGMYVGDTTSGAGVLNLVLELVANAYDLGMARRCSTISVQVAADDVITVEDDGPGLPVHGGDGLPPLEQLLTRWSRSPTVDGHRPHVHLGTGGLGLFIVNALSERFAVTSVRDGVEARALYARGQVVEPLACAPTRAGHGTKIEFRADPVVFAHPRVPRVELTQRLDDLMFVMPGVTLRWAFTGDRLAQAGLAGRVAWHTGCAIGEVASHRGSYATARGPIEVDVALAWRNNARRKRVIESFVNLQRTPGEGSHVDGVLQGIAQFLGGRARSEDPLDLVAAVSVILADVKYGNPTKDRLATPEVCAPVAEATIKALERWAAAHPEDAAAQRARRSKR